MMGEWGPGFGWGMMGGWWGMLIWLFFGLLVIAGIVALLIWIVRIAGGSNGHSDRAPQTSTDDRDEATAIARKRFASGEITREQYEELMRALSG